LHPGSCSHSSYAVVVDGEEVSRAQVQRLHARGSMVVGYLSVGTIERGRNWYPLVEPYRLELWDDWGEWYADTSQEGFRRAIEQTVAPQMMRKGLDGLFLDNTDMIGDHPAQAEGMRLLVTDLGTALHANGKLLIAQNGEETIGSMVPSLDGWNREDVTCTYNFDTGRYARVPRARHAEALAALRAMRRRGLTVFATDYVARAGSTHERASVAAARSAGAFPYVSDIGLTRVPSRPFPRP